MCAVLLRKFVMQHVTPQGTNNSVPIVLSLAPQTQGLLKQVLQPVVHNPHHGASAHEAASIAR